MKAAEAAVNKYKTDKRDELANLTAEKFVSVVERLNEAERTVKELTREKMSLGQKLNNLGYGVGTDPQDDKKSKWLKVTDDEKWLRAEKFQEQFDEMMDEETD